MTSTTMILRRPDRRAFLKSLAAGGILHTVPGAFAEALVLTPEQTIGPYYPDKIPLDKDNDLIILSDSITPAIGQVSWVSGRVLDKRGDPVRGAVVEIWQADNNGAYIHSNSPSKNRDPNFQGYGAFVTGSTGEYVFRTVKPGLYPGRTRHIHFMITYPGGQKLITQLYVSGESLNTNDGVLNGIRDTAARNSVIVPWSPLAGSTLGELSAKFDIVLGYTPADAPADAKPAISTQNGVVHGAAFQPGVAPGAWISIFGENLSPSTRNWNPSTEIVERKLPTALDGVTVSINNKPAAVNFISPKQINVQAPADTASGPVQVTVTTATGTSAPVTVNLQSALPGFFLFPESYIAAVRSDGTYLGLAVPAKPGDNVALYGTGFGPTNPVMPAGEVVEGVAPLANQVTIRIDSIIVPTAFAGLTSAGQYQFNVTIPDLPDGDHAVSAEVGGVRTQSLAKIRIQKS